MNNALEIEAASETRLRVVRRAECAELEVEAVEVLAQLEVLEEALGARLAEGDAALGAPVAMLRAVAKKLRAALP
jgi:hypothetical protein